MPEVIEMTEQEKRQLEIQNFRPPKAIPGDIVRWFKEADRSSQGYRALVLAVGERALRVQVLNTDYLALLNSVHHIDDPEIKARKGLRQYGAWDFTERDKDRDEKIAALEGIIETKERMNGERISALTKRLDTLESELGVKKTATRNT